MATTQNTHLDLEAAAVDGGCSRLSDASEDSTTVVGLSLSLSSSSSSSSEEEEEEGRRSAVSEYSVVDLGGGGGGGEGTNNKKVHNLLKIERDCRICHLSLDLTNQDCENGIAMELGCCCKEDLAAAHKHCAEAWFKIKGNKTCEICGSIAHNVAGANEAELMEHWNEANDAISSAANAHGGTTTAPLDNRNFWRGHRFLNFLLACMVFAFVISWLFHFNVPS